MRERLSTFGAFDLHPRSPAGPLLYASFSLLQLALHSPPLLRSHLFYVGFRGHAEDMLADKASPSHRVAAAAATSSPRRSRQASVIEVITDLQYNPNEKRTRGLSRGRVRVLCVIHPPVPKCCVFCTPSFWLSRLFAAEFVDSGYEYGSHRSSGVRATLE